MPAPSILADYFSFQTIAADAQTSVRTVRRWAYATVPGLPVTRLGGHPLVHKNDFAEWLAARRSQRNVPRKGVRS